jgi:HEPN domain-containing protein
MNSQEKFEYWLDSAQVGLDAIDDLFKSGHWLLVAFHCQQTIEKLVKGLYILYINDNVPLLHNIRAVFGRFEDQLTVPVSQDIIIFLNDLSQYYIKARYPDYKQKLSRQLNLATTELIAKKTHEVFEWLLTLRK